MTRFGIDGLFLTAITFARPRAEQRNALENADLIKSEDTSAVRLFRAEGAASRLGDVGLERLAPGLHTAIEHRLCFVAEPAKQEPETRGDGASCIVVHEVLLGLALC